VRRRELVLWVHRELEMGKLGWKQGYRGRRILNICAAEFVNVKFEEKDLYAVNG
jgi:hypothetical protein